MAEVAVSFTSQDLFDFPDPYPMFAGLRATSPVFRAMRRPSGDGAPND